MHFLKKRFIVYFFTLLSIYAQAQKTTYILIRHAEKDTNYSNASMMQADPPLSKEGAIRANNLPKVLQQYSLNAIFSTKYQRTKLTVGPLANQYQLPIEEYDPKLLSPFAEKLMSSEFLGKTVVIVGHSNTTPALVNLLIKQNKYLPLDESVYNKMWIISAKKEKIIDELVEY